MGFVLLALVLLLYAPPAFGGKSRCNSTYTTQIYVNQDMDKGKIGAFVVKAFFQNSVSKGGDINHKLSSDDFHIKGIGYSPVPPGKHIFASSLDYFTQEYRYMWERDIPLIRNMGANVIRLWSWDFSSDHTDFLDFCYYQNDLFVLVPFAMSSKDYPSLLDAYTIKQALQDWRAFLMKIKDHPAVFGYMVGNELDSDYGGQIDALFGLVNQMKKVKNSVEIVPHPLTIPLSAKSFELYVNKYYNYLDIDFWSLQYYGTKNYWVDKINSSYIGQVTYNLQKLVNTSKLTGSPLEPNEKKMRPLVFTEYGSDALSHEANNSKNNIPTNYTEQSLGLCGKYQHIYLNHYWPSNPPGHENPKGEKNKFVAVAGGIIMEWVDEWRKGDFADVRHTQKNIGCPNQRSDVHTYCARDLAPNNTAVTQLLYEEWLGIMEQANLTYQENNRRYCIRQRPVYCAMQEVWRDEDKLWGNLPYPQWSDDNDYSHCRDIARKYWDPKHPDHTPCLLPKQLPGDKTEGNPYADTVKFKGEDIPYYCGYKRSIWLYSPVIWSPSILLIIFVLILGTIVNYGWWTKKQRLFYDDNESEFGDPESQDLGDDDEPEKTHLFGKKGDDENTNGDTYGGEFDPNKFQTFDCTEGKHVQEMVRQAFVKYTLAPMDGSSAGGLKSQFFPVPQERLVCQIWDKFVFLGGNLEAAVRTVYEQTMEGYYIWKAEEPEQMNEIDMLSDLALYSIVLQWAGTILHASEKCLEIFEFARAYLADVMPDASQMDETDRQRIIRGLHHSLIEMFRVYYLKVDNENATFDELNMDAMKYRFDDNSKYYAGMYEEFKERDSGDTMDRMEDIMKAYNVTGQDATNMPEHVLLKPITETHDPKVVHPYLQYHVLPRPEEHVTSPMAQMFFGARDPFESPFPQYGGVLTLMFNWSWIIRMLMWLWMISWYMQSSFYSTELCLGEAMQYLASGDSVWLLFVQLLHRRVLGRFTIPIVLQILFYFLTSLTLMAAWSADISVEYGILGAGTVSGSVCPGPGGASGKVGGMVLFMCSVQKYLSATSSDNPMNRAFAPFGLNAPFGYLVAQILIVTFWELYLFCKWTPAGPIAGRFDLRVYSTRYIRIVFITIMVIGSGLGVAFYAPVDGINHTHTTLLVVWPSMIKDLYVVFVPMLVLGLSTAGAYVVGKLTMGFERDSWARARKEVSYLFQNGLFWGLFLMLNYLTQKSLIIPSVIKVRPAICACHENDLMLTTQEFKMCEWRVQTVCIVSVLFLWLSTVLVGFSVTYAVFQVLVCAFGTVQAKIQRVGNVQSWQDVQNNFWEILDNCLPVVSRCFDPDYCPAAWKNKDAHWNEVVTALYKDCLLTSAERAKYSIKEPGSGQVPNFANKPKNGEAERRIIGFLWGLEATKAHKRVSHHSEDAQRYRVLHMPCYSVVVPCYNETVIFPEDELRTTRQGKKRRISMIEYLANTFWDEWENFSAIIKAQDPSWITEDDNKAMELLEAFLELNQRAPLSNEVILQIRLWASMRGQTLCKTLFGLINARKALVKLSRMELPEWEEVRIQELVNRKYQIVIAHQTFDFSKDISKHPSCIHEEGVRILFKMYRHFEVVYNSDGNFRSVHQRLKPEARLPKTAEEKEAKKNQKKKKFKVEFDKTVTLEVGGKQLKRKLFKLHGDESFESNTIQRVGRLVIGEGKAENQCHALQFVRHSVLQANDMNQYFAMENGNRIPFMLYDFFKTADMYEIDEMAWDHRKVIPKVRLLGVPEWCYTRPLSMVGELMGGAEWCFVTIFHRVLNWPLRQRLHYGHPDFFDTYWVRTRGGSSKASRLVNTNEDIFAGYELTARGEQISYVEFLECQKGRESQFSGAFTFEAKLAQGAAQQCRSWDVYLLNRKLDFFMRLSLFYSSVAFYITNMIMTISINYYMLAIVLFAVAGVTYHQLGLLNAVIAVPWLLQVGYFMALPMLVELIIQRGWLRGVWDFLMTLPMGLIFFVFHLRTKTFFFVQGLLLGKGGYRGTGRLFGLERQTLVELYKQYGESHYHEALLLFVSLFLYGVFSGEGFLPYVIRTILIILIVFSWLAAPILFNPYPTAEDVQNDIKEFRWWLAAEYQPPTDEQVGAMFDQLHAKHEERMNNKGRTKDGKKPFEVIQGNFWATQTSCWQTWYWQDGILRQWIAEDEFFPSSIPLAMQKMYIMIEYMAPWILLTFMYWKVDSLWYLILVVSAAVFVLVLVDLVFRGKHEYILQAKMLVVLPFVPAYLYLQEAVALDIGDLAWSFVFYWVWSWLLLDFITGFMAFAMRLSIYGFAYRDKTINADALQQGEEEEEEDEDDPDAGERKRHASEQRNIELFAVHSEEERQVDLFARRLRIPKFVTSLHSIRPVLSLIPLSAFSWLSAQFSDALTTMQFNSRVTESWKKAYVRPTPAQQGDDDDKQRRQPHGAGPGVTRSREKSKAHHGGHHKDPFIRQRAFSPGIAKQPWAPGLGGGGAGGFASSSTHAPGNSSLSPLQSPSLGFGASSLRRAASTRQSRQPGSAAASAFFT